MNIPSLVVLLVIAALFALAVRHIVRQSRAGACGGCGEKSCPSRGGAREGGACPSVQRSLEEVEARLGPRP